MRIADIVVGKRDRKDVGDVGPLPASIALRKLMLRRRVDLFRRNEDFQNLWDQVFPKHDLATLRLKRPAWDQHWAEAARAYHADRKKFKAIA
jgi:hypothetical protein